MDVSNTTWDFKKADADDEDSVSIGSISEEESMNSKTMSLSPLLSESTEEATDSSTLSSSFSQSNGPLYDLSQILNHLPIKRGLSMFYEGKAQSFTSLATVENIGDLPKKATPSCRKRMKSGKSYAEDLDRSSHNKVISHISPKPIISKQPSRGSLVSALTTRGSFLSIAIRKKF